MSCGFLFGCTNVIIIIMTSTAFANDKEPPQFSVTNFIAQIQLGVSHKLARYSFCQCIAIQPKEHKSWQQSSQQDHTHRHYTRYQLCILCFHLACTPHLIRIYCTIVIASQLHVFNNDIIHQSHSDHIQIFSCVDSFVATPALHISVYNS